MLQAFNKHKSLFLYLLCLIVGIGAFNIIIVRQEEVLRTYFVIKPQERIRESNASLSDSLSKYFSREIRHSDIEQVKDYLQRFGRTTSFQIFFIFQKPDGSLCQIGPQGEATVSAAILRNANVYPVTIQDGALSGYLLTAMQESDSSELREGFAKYTMMTYSLRSILLLLIAAFIAVIFYQDYSAKMRLARDIAEVKATNDALTGMHTRDYFMRALSIEMKRSNIYKTPFALLMLDIDHFKEINDTYGHLAGDEALQEVAKAIKHSTRSADILARYGGEEFAIIVPYIEKSTAIAHSAKSGNFSKQIEDIAERIRRGVEGLELCYPPHKFNITISIGVSFFHPSMGAVSGTTILERSDAALYESKRRGRNRVTVDSTRRLNK